MHSFYLQLLRVLTVTILTFLTQSLYVLPAKSQNLSSQVDSLDSRQQKEAKRLFNQGIDEYSSRQFQQALLTFQKALAIYQNIQSHSDVADTLRMLGKTYLYLANYPEALNLLNQALIIERTIGYKSNIRDTLNTLGAVYNNLSQYSQAIKFYHEALAINQALNDKEGTLSTLKNIADIYQSQSKYSEALKYYNQSLAISREIGNLKYLAFNFNGIGTVYYLTGNYYQALDYYQQSLVFAKTANNLEVQSASLNNIGLVYSRLGQYDTAIKYYQQTIEIQKRIGDKTGEGQTLHNVGFAFDEKKQYFQALSFYQQAVKVFRTIGRKSSLSNTLNNIGYTYQLLGQSSQALKYLEEALRIVQQTGDRRIEGNTLDSIGTVYKNRGKFPQALALYQQALAIRKEIGDRPGERITLANIGDVLIKQNQPQLAILFYKQSVNITESIRKDLRLLPNAQQKSYTNTIADTYRNLANLLLQQDRILEALQVLDLLKVQEIDDYLHNVRGNDITNRGVDVLPQEQQINRGFNDILTQQIQLGRKLAEFRKTPLDQRTTNQIEQIIELENKESEIIQEFLNFLKSPEVIRYIADINPTIRDHIVPLSTLTDSQRILQSLHERDENAVLLYPLISENSLELVVATSYTPPIHYKVDVKKQEINQAISDFSEALKDPSLDVKTPANKLYKWLIKPIEPGLAAAKAKTIIYAPDGQLRYIPLAALYDGKQWLVERFNTNYITALSFTRFDNQPLPELQILAGATTNRHIVNVGFASIDFKSLPFAGKEVENIAAIIPKTKTLIDEQFNQKQTIYSLRNYPFVHLATHANFVIGQPEESFILLGDGNIIRMPEIQTLQIKADLVVLSACNTGIGGINNGNGAEILGFGYQMQNAGAKATIASLWPVDDGGTQILMNTFYALLHQGNISKTEALRQAQVIMITGDFKLIGSQQDRVILQSTRNTISPNVVNNLSHPHYWAPFFLIGNGL
ncbi:tetratricopeptide repeat protein [Nostoc sp. 2RC]|uniref:tetratricopeptide repeat protein n=1 Tax=Nostoc sp. 2RC TaxID=2485484 RepID=UPI001627598E|nr:tetratricopeptide repeat protein [Nostoc sp. 2RC]MBC1236886.1 tetratricopeptide repeat protein [Nostoc sp. 2RC]